MNLREIDRLVAEKVMGWEPVYDDGDLISFITGYGTLFFSDDDECEWNPSTDIRDAWLVVEELIDRGYDFNLWRSEQREYNAEFQIQKKDGFVVSYGESDHAPTAICFASLEAVGVDVK
jgi:hypothetical protein